MIYDFIVEDFDEGLMDLSKYKNKVLLIENSATHCRFTASYDDLQLIYERHRDQGFEILDFPCDQFHHQTPQSDKKTKEFCDNEYAITFPIFCKIEVLGENKHPLFAYLTQQQPFTGLPNNEASDSLIAYLPEDYKENDEIKWNFTKFLVNRKGEVVARFEPSEPLENVEKAIIEELNKG